MGVCFPVVLLTVGPVLSTTGLFGSLRMLSHDVKFSYGQLVERVDRVRAIREVYHRYPELEKPRTRSGYLEKINAQSFEASPSLKGVDVAACWNDGVEDAVRALAGIKVGSPPSNSSMLCPFPDKPSLISEDVEVDEADLAGDITHVVTQSESTVDTPMSAQFDPVVLHDAVEAEVTNKFPSTVLYGGEHISKARLVAQLYRESLAAPRAYAKTKIALPPTYTRAAKLPTSTTTDPAVSGDVFVTKGSYLNGRISAAFVIFLKACTVDGAPCLLPLDGSAPPTDCVVEVLATSLTLDAKRVVVTPTSSTLEVAPSALTPVRLQLTGSTLWIALDSFELLVATIVDPSASPQVSCSSALPLELLSLEKDLKTAKSVASVECRICGHLIRPADIRPHIGGHLVLGQAPSGQDAHQDACGGCGDRERACRHPQFSRTGAVRSRCPASTLNFTRKNLHLLQRCSNFPVECLTCGLNVYSYSFNAHQLREHPESKQRVPDISPEERQRVVEAVAASSPAQGTFIARCFSFVCPLTCLLLLVVFFVVVLGETSDDVTLDELPPLVEMPDDVDIGSCLATLLPPLHVAVLTRLPCVIQTLQLTPRAFVISLILRLWLRPPLVRAFCFRPLCVAPLPPC